MGRYPVNVMPCDHSGCEDVHTTPCVITDYWRRRFSIRVYIGWLGVKGAIRHLWRMWRDGFADLPPEYYCFEHAKEEGFCWGCGGFWSGCENFDFHPSRLCSNCRGDLEEPEPEWNDEWLAGWAEYPGQLLSEDLDFDLDEYRDC